jgi:uncharacterized protein YjiS (DUF1127 family)
MHSPRSFHELHGIGVRTRTWSRLQWIWRVFAALSGLRLVLQAELRARRAAAELARMDDQMLRDIGISRSQIESVLRRPTGVSVPRDRPGGGQASADDQWRR